MAKKILGRADIVVDGQTLRTLNDATLDTGGISRGAVVGNAVHGFREEVKESKLEVSVVVDDSFSASQINSITDATVNFHADTGQTWVIRGAWCAETINIGQKEGTAKAVFMGPPAEEMSA